jgi:hypothetical protein
VATAGAAAKVGLCAVVQGRTDTRGAVAATSIALSSKVSGSCDTFRRRPGGTNGAPGGGNAPGGGAAPSGGAASFGSGNG